MESNFRGVLEAIVQCHVFCKNGTFLFYFQTQNFFKISDKIMCKKWLQRAGYMHFFSNIDDTTFIVENYKKACLTKFYGFQNECFQNSKYLWVFVKE